MPPSDPPELDPRPGAVLRGVIGPDGRVVVVFFFFFFLFLSSSLFFASSFFAELSSAKSSSGAFDFASDALESEAGRVDAVVAEDFFLISAEASRAATNDTPITAIVPSQHTRPLSAAMTRPPR